jgi:hypothetical protein
MPTRTISAAGGNWNATGTWVEAAVPIAGDDILGLSTSGNLTVNVGTVNVRDVNFSNYLGTLTLNQTLNIGNGTTVGTSSFSPTMSFATATTFNTTNCFSFNGTGAGVGFIRTNGKKLPYVKHVKGGGAGSLQLLDDLNVTTLGIGLGNQATTILGTYSIFCNHFVRESGGGGSLGTIVSTTSTLNFVGPTASFTNNSPSDSVVLANINVVIDVGASGTFSTFGPMGIAGNTTVAFKYWWKSGNLGGDKQLQLWSVNTGSQPIRLDFAGSGTWSYVYYNDYNATTADRQLILISDLYFDNLVSSYYGGAASAITRRALTTSGSTGALKGGELLALPAIGINTTGTNLTSPTFSTPIIKLHPGVTHSFSDIRAMGYDTPIQFRNSNNQVNNNAWILSATAGTRATIQFTGDKSKPSYFVYYTDINNVGNTIYNYQGGQTNSINIGTISMATTQAWPFVN